MKTFLRTLLAVGTLKALAMTSSAVVLDWGNLPSGQSWTNGDLTNTFTNVDPGNASGSITVGVVSSGVTFTSGYPQNATSPTIATGDGPYLRLATNSMGSSSNSISVTITFNNYPAGVSNVAFTLLDVDATVTTGDVPGGYIDRISAISATPVSGAPNSVAFTATNTSNTVNTVSNNGTTALTVTGNTAGGNITDHTGDVTFTTDATPITSITFTWNNPGPYFDGQIIALGNISFTPVPEIGASFGALAICGGLVAAWRRRPAQRGLAKA